MYIECVSCPVRDRHCADCMVTVLLGMPAPQVPLAPLIPAAHDDQGEFGLPLDDRERRGLQALLGAGLICESEALGARAVDERRQVLRVTG